jgi:hypothetical protein
MTTAYCWYWEDMLPVPARRVSRLVFDMIEMPTSFCARLYGRRSARNRALKAVGCARRDVGPRAGLEAGSVPCGGGG